MIRLNGRIIENAVGLTLAQLIERERYTPSLVAVECNEEIVCRSAYPHRVLAEGDVVEVVHFVGGG
jgi:sulfur carrier protein